MPSQTCFVISPISALSTGPSKRADQVFKHIIEPVVSPLGYAATRADHMKPPGIITSELLAAVADADLVVADLTDQSANVFYALAIRHAAQRPVVQLIDSAQRAPFELADMRAVYIDIHDLDSVEEARKQMRADIAVASSASLSAETPIAVAKSMKTLWECEEPMAPVIAEALREIRALELERIRREELFADSRLKEGHVSRGNGAHAPERPSTAKRSLFPGHPLFLEQPLGTELDGIAMADNERDTGKRDGKPASSSKARKGSKRGK